MAVVFSPQEAGSQDLGEKNCRYWDIMKSWKQTGGDLPVYGGKTTISEIKVKTEYMNFRDLLVLLWAQWVPPLLDHHIHPSEQDIRQDNHQSSKRELTNPLVGTFNPVKYNSLMCFYMRPLRLT